LLVSSFLRIFSFQINSTTRYLPDKHAESEDYDVSPFRKRIMPYQEPETYERKPRKGVTIVDPHNADDLARLPENHSALAPLETQGLHMPHVGDASPAKASILRDTSQFHSLFPSRPTSSSGPPPTPASFQPEVGPPPVGDKSLQAQWTLNQFLHNSLNPRVSGGELEEYDRYVSHPQNLPLVVSSAGVPESEWGAHLDMVEYLNSSNTVLGSTGTDMKVDDGYGGRMWDVNEVDLINMTEFLNVAESPLTVLEEDGPKKRYKRYRQWLKGKSLFKQSKVDLESRGASG
jgi:phosphatidylinositol 3,5-bisphosphate 5-phosphatase